MGTAGGVALITGIGVCIGLGQTSGGAHAGLEASKAGLTPGFPNARNTGVPAGTHLKSHTGNLTIRKDGTVIKGWKLHGSLDIYAKNVTIVDSEITSANWWGVNLRGSGTGLRVLHSTITGVKGKGPDNGGEDYAVSNMGSGTVEVGFDNVSKFGDALSMGHGQIHDNYVHGLQAFRNLSHTYQHTDAVISDGSDKRGLVVRHNTLLNWMPASKGASAAVGLFADDGPVTNTVIDHNLIAGGAYALYAGGAGSAKVKITNNLFSTRYWPKCGYYGPVAYWNPKGAGNVWSGNKWADGPRAGRAVVA
ncbi:hypothetical protein [Actinoallomurus sp. CA-150999]|uniref:hypothetical protein n=1 Tax=Actinoallomurus sp. CA-150999 TaxID=3239887 RepID=UPI003D949598